MELTEQNLKKVICVAEHMSKHQDRPPSISQCVTAHGHLYLLLF